MGMNSPIYKHVLLVMKFFVTLHNNILLHHVSAFSYNKCVHY